MNKHAAISPSEALLQEMKQTKGSRFNAAKRLEDRDRKRTTLIAYASVTVVVVTLLPAFFDVPLWLRNTVSLATIAMSLLILAYSMLQTQSRDLLVAHQLHECAMEINSLRRGMRAIESCTAEEVASYSKKYDDILRRYAVNHDPIDYEKYRLEHSNEFADISEATSQDLKSDVRQPERILGVLTGFVMATAPILALAALLTSKSDSLIHWVKQIIAIWASS